MKKYLWIYIIGINLLVILGFWYSYSGNMAFSSSSSFFIGFGRLFGLLAAYSVLVQMLLIGRIKWIERVFGLDKLSKIHKWNGYSALSFMILHFVFIIIGYGIVNKLSFFDQFIILIGGSNYTLFGLLALLLFILIVGISITIVRTRLRYESWYYVHLLTYIAILLAFIHQINSGEDFAHRIFFYYWCALYVFVFGNFVFYRFFRPIWFYNKHEFYVSKIKKENSDVNSVYISGKNMSTFKREAGQFIIVRFFAKGYWYEAHPFSISNSDNEADLRITPKMVGDFTSRIQRIPVGTKVLIDGPHGSFIKSRASRQKIALLAAGIGITPIRSLMGSFENSKDMILLYSNKTSEDVVFKEEIEEIAKNKKLKVNYIFSQDNKYTKERIGKETIERFIPDIAERDVYVCGPKEMIKDVVDYLKGRGLKKEQIHFEKFSLHG